MALPEAFKQQMREQLPNGYVQFEEAMQAPPRLSIRLHPEKIFSLKENTKRVKWNPRGVYLNSRPIFTLDPRYHAGAYYVQEPSSMFVGTVVRQIFNPEKPVRALDLAAAPGGKSTLLLDELPEGSFLLANEVIRSRYQVLRENLTRWGSPCSHTSHHDPRDFSELKNFFDLVLVDAPCSGEGMFRKDAEAVQHWSPEQVQLCSSRQQRILQDAMELVRPNGWLIYCTCTFNAVENEQNARWIAAQDGFEPWKLSIDDNWGITEYALGYQFYPHKTEGEGFYLACFRREPTAVARPLRPKPFQYLQPLPRRQTEQLSSWISDPERFRFYQKPKGGILAFLREQEKDAQLISQYLKRLHLGTEIGLFKGKQFVPSHDLALGTMISDELPSLALDHGQALKYLKKDNLKLDDIPTGWILARYAGLNLGWIKGLKNRINNYLPKHWRIRMDLDNSEEGGYEFHF